MEKRRYTAKIIIFAVAALLAMLSPLNVVCYVPALLLAVHLCLAGKWLFVAVVLPFAAGFCFLGFAPGAVFFCLTAAALCVSAWVCAGRGFTAGKTAVICAVAYGAAFLAACAAMIYISGGKIQAGFLQQVYGVILETVREMAEYLGLSEFMGMGLDITSLESFAYALTLSIPGLIAALSGAAGIAGGLIAAASRPGLKPVFLQYQPGRWLAITFIVAEIVDIFAFGGEYAALGLAANIIAMALLPLFVVCCIGGMYKLIKANSLGLFVPLFIIICAFTVGLLSGMAYLGAYFTVKNAKNEPKNFE